MTHTLSTKNDPVHYPKSWTFTNKNDPYNNLEKWKEKQIAKNRMYLFLYKIWIIYNNGKLLGTTKNIVMITHKYLSKIVIKLHTLESFIS